MSKKEVVGADAYIGPYEKFCICRKSDKIGGFHCRGDVGIAPYDSQI